MLHILQGDGVDVLLQVGLSVRLLTEGVDQELTAATGQEELLQGLVCRHEHRGNILAGVIARRTIIVVVPSRIEGQHILGRHVVRVRQQRSALRALAHIALLEDGVGIGHARQVDAGLALLLIPVLIGFGSGCIVVGGTEAVEHTAEQVALAVGADQFGQVARGQQHVLHLVDVAVLTGHVGTDDLVAEDVGRLLCLVVRLTRHHLEVAVGSPRGDIVIRHLLFRKMDHHRTGGIHHDVEILVVVISPVGVVHRHVCPTPQMGDRVDHIGTRGMLHRLALYHGSGTVGDIRQHLHEEGVVEHRGIEQLALHRVGQVFIPPHAPGVILVEAVEGLVVGREHGLGTRLGQSLCIAQVINQAQIVGERAFQHAALRVRQTLRILHGIIDTTAEPRRIVIRVVQRIVVCTCHKTLN